MSDAPRRLYDRPTTKVQQSEIAFSTAGSARTISTTGAGPCIILAVRHRGSKNGFMAHVFSFTEIDPALRSGKWVLKKFAEQMKNDNADAHENNAVDVYMVGGYTLHSDLLIHSLNRFVKKLSNLVPIGTVHEHLKKNWVSNAVMDFDKGEIYYYDMSKDINKRPLDLDQGVLTSITNAVNPVCRLIEVEPDNTGSDAICNVS